MRDKTPVTPLRQIGDHQEEDAPFLSFYLSQNVIQTWPFLASDFCVLVVVFPFCLLCNCKVFFQHLFTVLKGTNALRQHFVLLLCSHVHLFYTLSTQYYKYIIKPLVFIYLCPSTLYIMFYQFSNVIFETPSSFSSKLYIDRRLYTYFNIYIFFFFLELFFKLKFFCFFSLKHSIYVSMLHSNFAI